VFGEWQIQKDINVSMQQLLRQTATT
jgi:hypothetical protein